MIWIPVTFEPWIEASILHFLLATTVIVAAHFVFRKLRHRILEEHCNMPALEDDEDDFPMKLGLRY